MSIEQNEPARCGTCASWIHEGESDMGACGHLAPPKNARGFVLPSSRCVMTPYVRKRANGYGSTFDSSCDNWTKHVAALNAEPKP